MVKSRKLAMVKRETEQKISVTFTKRKQGLFNKAAEFSILCDSQIAVLVRSPSKNKPKKKVYSFGHTSVRDVINAFLNNSLPTNNVDPIKESNPVSLIWNEINSAGTLTLTGGDDVSSNSSVLLKLEDFEYCDSVEELKKLVDGLENLVDQVKRISPNFNCETNNSDNNGDDYLIDLQDLVSDDFKNGDDHQLMEMLESELKDCDKIINNGECAIVPTDQLKVKEFSFDNDYEDTHIPFVDYWPSTP